MGLNGFEVIKTTGNIGIFRPCVFFVRSGTNQVYSMECDWERLSPFYMQKAKGRTSNPKELNRVKK